MLILSNSLTAAADEGSLKLATSLAKRIKQANEDAKIVSFEREYPQSDVHLELNKFHISKQLISLLKKEKGTVLYIPFPAPTLSMTLRVKILSLFARRRLKVMMIRQYPMNGMARWLLKSSKAKLVVFSQKAADFYRGVVGDRILYLKTGVDTKRFVPVSAEKQRELKQQYGFDPAKSLVLHVGHMKEGRNVGELMKISNEYQVLLVISSLSKERQSQALRAQLEQRENIHIVDEFIPDIQEIYQMADVYFFPVIQQGHCIDVPLSCFEAAACNKPVVTTDYGELSELKGRVGFYFMDDMEKNTIDGLLSQAMSSASDDIRSVAVEYDWDNVIQGLL